MGRIYRMVEPILLLLLKQKSAHGYELIHLANKHSLTDSVIDPAVVYRTLREMEKEGYVSSKWEIAGGGPAKRLYTITEEGNKLLSDWMLLLENQKKSMEKLIEEYREENK